MLYDAYQAQQDFLAPARAGANFLVSLPLAAVQRTETVPLVK